MPLPPSIRSLPEPVTIRSLPLPPVTTLLPSPPLSLSAPAPPDDRVVAGARVHGVGPGAGVDGVRPAAGVDPVVAAAAVDDVVAGPGADRVVAALGVDLVRAVEVDDHVVAGGAADGRRPGAADDRRDLAVARRRGRRRRRGGDRLDRQLAVDRLARVEVDRRLGVGLVDGRAVVGVGAGEVLDPPAAGNVGDERPRPQVHVVVFHAIRVGPVGVVVERELEDRAEVEGHVDRVVGNRVEVDVHLVVLDRLGDGDRAADGLRRVEVDRERAGGGVRRRPAVGIGALDGRHGPAGRDRDGLGVGAGVLAQEVGPVREAVVGVAVVVERERPQAARERHVGRVVRDRVQGELDVALRRRRRLVGEGAVDRLVGIQVERHRSGSDVDGCAAIGVVAGDIGQVPAVEERLGLDVGPLRQALRAEVAPRPVSAALVAVIGKADGADVAAVLEARRVLGERRLVDVDVADRGDIRERAVDLLARVHPDRRAAVRDITAAVAVRVGALDVADPPALVGFLADQVLAGRDVERRHPRLGIRGRVLVQVELRHHLGDVRRVAECLRGVGRGALDDRHGAQEGLVGEGEPREGAREHQARDDEGGPADAADRAMLKTVHA